MEKINYDSAIKNIRSELKTFLLNSNLKALVIGVSGGIDSALVCALADPVCKELGIELIGRSIPIETNKRDEMERAESIGKHFCTDFKEVNLKEEYVELKGIDMYDTIYDAKDDRSYKIRMGNFKARLRMAYLYNLAAKNRGLVLSTDNWTEWLLGFWTLHGDVGDYGMIQELWKSEVYDMTEWLVTRELFLIDIEKASALNKCIFALATDGLGVTDMGDLGQILPDFKGTSREGYKEVDRILQLWTNREKLGDMQRELIEDPYRSHPVVRRHIASEFKRHNPTNISRNLIVK